MLPPAERAAGRQQFGTLINNVSVNLLMISMPPSEGGSAQTTSEVPTDNFLRQRLKGFIEGLLADTRSQAHE
jgi:hypothetical protein